MDHGLVAPVQLFARARSAHSGKNRLPIRADQQQPETLEATAAGRPRACRIICAAFCTWAVYVEHQTTDVSRLATAVAEWQQAANKKKAANSSRRAASSGPRARRTNLCNCSHVRSLLEGAAADARPEQTGNISGSRPARQYIADPRACLCSCLHVCGPE